MGNLRFKRCLVKVFVILTISKVFSTFFEPVMTLAPQILEFLAILEDIPHLVMNLSSSLSKF